MLLVLDTLMRFNELSRTPAHSSILQQQLLAGNLLGDFVKGDPNKHCSDSLVACCDLMIRR